MGDHQYRAIVSEYFPQDTHVFRRKDWRAQITHTLGVNTVQSVSAAVPLTLQPLLNTLTDHGALAVGDGAQGFEGLGRGAGAGDAQDQSSSLSQSPGNVMRTAVMNCMLSVGALCHRW